VAGKKECSLAQIIRPAQLRTHSASREIHDLVIWHKRFLDRVG